MLDSTDQFPGQSQQDRDGRKENAAYNQIKHGSVSKKSHLVSSIRTR